MRATISDLTMVEICGFLNLALGGVCYATGSWYLGLALQASGMSLLNLRS